MEQKIKTDKAIFNGMTEIIALSRGEISQNELAEMKGISKSTMSREIGKLFRDAMKQLADKVENHREDKEELRNSYENEIEKTKQLFQEAAKERDELRATVSEQEQQLQHAEQLLNSNREELLAVSEERDNLIKIVSSMKQEYKDWERKEKTYQKKWDNWVADILPVRMLRTNWTSFILCVLLGLLDFHILAGLLIEKIHWFFAYGVSAGLSVVLIAFTVNTNKLGRRLAIVLTFVAAGLYFHFLPALSEVFAAAVEVRWPKDTYLADIAFTVLLPYINVVLSQMLTEETKSQL